MVMEDVIVHATCHLFSASQVYTVLKAVILPGHFSIQLGVLYMIHPKFHHSRTILVAANF